ncbi:MAG: hypothetical protein D6726_09990, partial [Nitrospirae bacterium]
MDWQEELFTNCILKTTISRKNKINKSEVLPFGKYPVIDQGQSFISGYCNDDEKVIKDSLPYVIFGDHTRIFKYVDFPFVLGADGTKVIKPNPSLFNEKFFYFACLYLDIPNRGYNRHYTILKEKKIKYPKDKNEQRKIAAVLSLVQRAIEQQERLIQVTTELKKALMKKLFTEGLRGEPQKMTEIGPLPESWEVVELGEVADKIEYGFTASALSTGKIKFLRISDIQDFSVNWNHVPYCNCSDEIIDKYLLNDGDILFARIGATTGKSFFVQSPPKSIYASYLIRVRVKEILSAAFLSQFCNTHAYWHQINQNKGGKIKGGINASILKRLKIALPSDYKEQENIAASLQIIDNKINYIKHRLNLLQSLFRTLLHQLMTAQIR